MVPLRTARALALILVVSWLAAATSSQIHGMVAQHVVCPEHGKLEEVHHHLDDGHEHQGLDQVSAPGTSLHHSGNHGCVFLTGFASAEPPVFTTPTVRVEADSLDPLPPGVGGPRAPPLSFAPKTSPPLA
jgi:hypothetical protein